MLFNKILDKSFSIVYKESKIVILFLIFFCNFCICFLFSNFLDIELYKDFNFLMYKSISIYHFEIIANCIFFLAGCSVAFLVNTIIVIIISFEFGIFALNLRFLCGSLFAKTIDGFIYPLYILATGGTEVGIVLALLVIMHRYFNTIDGWRLRDLRG